MDTQTLKVTTTGGLCRIVFDRPHVGNAINARMIEEFTAVLDQCAGENLRQGASVTPITAVVIEGGAEVFCAGGDFEAIAENGSAGDPEPLYNVWLKLAEGPFVTIGLVKGRVNAGGVGFVAACDIVIADQSASFSLSELLFGLYPACVLPFLIRRIGRQRAHYMTLMTKPVAGAGALDLGLVDVLAEDPEQALHQHWARLKHLSKPAIARYKAYMATCSGDVVADKASALEGNRAVFSDPDVMAGVRRYVRELKFPWEE